VPQGLEGRVGKHFLFDVRSCPESREAQQVAALGEYLTSLGLRTDSNNILGLRWAALSAGLGVVRRNNFFYGENGTRYWLWAWATDAEMELLRENEPPKPCPDGCELCRKACPTGSLSAPYTMSMLTCVEHLNASDVKFAPDDAKNAQMGAWLYGCDACQDACPFNAKQVGAEEFPGLAALAEFLEPQRILAMSYDEIGEKFAQKFFYIGADSLWKWKVNALNVLANAWKPEYASAVRAACGDGEQNVREKAEFIARENGVARVCGEPDNELWDVYDANRAPTGRTMVRGSKIIPPEDYHLVVRAFIVGRDGRILLTKRSPNKRGAGLWEVPSGSVLAGEDSRAGVLREVLEECGVALDANGGEIFRQGSWTAETSGDISHHWDEWLFRRDVDLSKVRLQEGETCDSMLATVEELEALISEGRFVNGEIPLRELRRILQLNL